MARERCGPRFAVLGWIPGSVGGAVRMNAGAHGSEFGEFVHRIKGIDARTGAVVTLDGRDVRWEYRRAGLPSDLIVTQVVLRPDAADHGKTLAAYETAGAERRARQPRTAGVGSVFRNAGTTAAGLLLDRCGCKGMSHGAVRISPRHANFVEAGPGAVERDLVTLLLRARHLVLQKTGVRLMPEVVCADPDSEQRLCHSPRAYHAVVLKGGPSSERIVSLKSGVAVATALRQAGYRVTEIDVTEARLPDLPEDTDVVFPALHGAFGEDGQVQALLEAAGVPYVGSDSQASALIMSKTRSKACVTAAGIPTPRAFPVLSADAPVPAELRFPAIVKPDCQGSTVGMTRLLRPSSWWRRALRKAFAVDSGVFVEEFITGTEITVGLLDGTPLPVVEIVPPKGRMFDYDAKYDHRRGHTHYLCPPEAVSEAVQARAQELAATAYKALGAKDMLRVDFIVDAQGAPWFLEANSLPGFTGTSLLPMAASRHGLSFVELCAHLVHTNLRDR
jgi:D-alanine-D-alanine ligase